MQMQSSAIRNQSLIQTKRLGYSFTPPIPLIDGDSLQPRTQQELGARALALSVVVAVSYGLERAVGQAWLEREKLYEALSPSERSFVEDIDSANASIFNARVEALGIFAWALGHVSSLPFEQALPSNLVRIYPDLRNEESPQRFLAGCHLRSSNEMIAMLDLAYCLHWCVVDSPAKLTKVQLHVVAERRRALEWMRAREDWEDLSLDT